VFVSVIGLLLAAPAVLLLAYAPTVAVALGALAIYSCARYFSDANAMPVLCLYVDPRYRATSWGVSTLVSCTVGAVGIYAAGWLRDANIPPTRLFQLACTSMLLSAVFMAFLSRQEQVPQEA
jgi:hypothetical protein